MPPWGSRPGLQPARERRCPCSAGAGGVADCARKAAGAGEGAGRDPRLIPRLNPHLNPHLTGGCGVRTASVLLLTPRSRRAASRCKPGSVVPRRARGSCSCWDTEPATGVRTGGVIGTKTKNCTLPGKQAAPGEKMHFALSPTVMPLLHLLLRPLGKVVSLTEKREKEKKI